MSNAPVTPPPRRRRPVASVRALLLAVAVVAVLVGWQVNRTRARRLAVEAIERGGGRVFYDYQTEDSMGRPVGKPPTPRWLREAFGEDSFASVRFVILGTINRPRVTDGDLAVLGPLDRIEVLLLQYTSITDAGLAHLAGMKGLQHLRLYCPKVTDAGLAHLDGLPALRSVDLSTTAITDAGLAHFRGRAGLVQVVVSDTAVTDQGAAALDATFPSPVTLTGRPRAAPAPGP